MQENDLISSCIELIIPRQTWKLVRIRHVFKCLIACTLRVCNRYYFFDAGNDTIVNSFSVLIPLHLLILS